MGTGARAGRSGASNLYERDGVYYARVQVGGKSYRRSLKTGNRREAERRLQTWLKDLSPYHGDTAHRFKEAAVLWLEAGQWKPKTAATYAKQLRVVLEEFGDIPWERVTKSFLWEWTQGRLKKGNSMATVNRYLSMISGIADHVRHLPGWPDVNPVRDLPKRPERKFVYVRPPVEDIELMLGRFRGPFADFARLSLLTGMRRDEIAKLEWRHVTADTVRLFVTKSGIPRTIPLCPEAANIIHRQPHHKGSPFVFTTQKGGRYVRATEMWREGVKRSQKLAHKAGRELVEMRLHDLRHEFAIRYLENGGSLYVLQKLLGHSTIKLTEHYLAFLTPEQAQSACTV